MMVVQPSPAKKSGYDSHKKVSYGEFAAHRSSQGDVAQPQPIRVKKKTPSKAQILFLCSEWV